MGERLKTRQEVAREDVELPEELKNVRALQELGVLMPLSGMELYHGRSGDGNPWRVVDINNAGDNTGNRNINKRAALNTGRREVARKFATARSMKDGGNAEVYRINSDDLDASIVDLYSIGQLSSREIEMANRHLQKTRPPILLGAPLRFEERNVVNMQDFEKFLKAQNEFISHEMATGYAKRAGISESLAWRMCGAVNARLLLSDVRNIPLATDHFMHGTQRDLRYRQFEDGAELTLQRFTARDGKEKEAPINPEYIASWLKSTHIVGARMNVESATLGGEIVTNYLLFDFDRVNTDEHNERRKREKERKLGAVALLGERLGQFGEGRPTKHGEKVLSVINDLYTKPREIVEAAKALPGYAEVFESDVGVWEKFTLEEHTETVLSNFERNYADKMHAKTIPLAKMALLVHDIGKPRAARAGQKNMQNQYNKIEANRFMEKVGLSEKERWLVLRLIGKGMEVTERYVLRGNEDKSVLRDFKTFCAETVQKYSGKEPTSEEIKGLRDICLVLQTCDSAAYTDMAVTRSAKQRELYYRNSPSFNRSFDNSRKGIDGRGVRMGRSGV